MTLPSVTVIITTHNDAPRVDALVSRLLGVRYAPLNAVIVDDASTDQTPALLRERTSKLANVVIVERSVNGGAGAARNTGLEVATGLFIWFADSDDDWHPHLVAELVSAAVTHEADIVQCLFDRKTEEEMAGWMAPMESHESPVASVIREPIVALLKGEIEGYLWNKLFASHLFETFRFPPLSTQEDFVAVAHAVMQSARVVEVGKVLYTHCIRPGSLSQSSAFNLDNLQVAAALVHDMLLTEGVRVASDLWHYFEVWFVWVATFRTSSHLPIAPATARTVRRNARSHLGAPLLIAAAKHDIRLAGLALSIRVFGEWCGPLLRGVQRLRRLAKATVRR